MITIPKFPFPYQLLSALVRQISPKAHRFLRGRAATKMVEAARNQASDFVEGRQEVTPTILGPPPNDARVIVLIVTSGRHHLILPNLDHMISSSEPHELGFLVLGETDDSLFLQHLAQKYEGRVMGAYGEFRGTRLGLKWQTGVETIRQRIASAEFVGILGSDDFLSPAAVRALLGLRSPSFIPGLVSFDSWHVASLSQGMMDFGTWGYEFRNNFQPLGAGRFYSRDFLEQNDWKLFDPNLDSLLDDFGYERFRASPYPEVRLNSDSEIFVLLWKGPWEMKNSYDDFLASPGLVRLDAGGICIGIVFGELNSLQRHLTGLLKLRDSDGTHWSWT